MTEGEVLEVLMKRCQNLGTVSRMNPAVLAQIASRLAQEPGMTEKKVMEACQSPMSLAQYFK